MPVIVLDVTGGAGRAVVDRVIIGEVVAADVTVLLKVSAAAPINRNMRFVFIDNCPFYELHTATPRRVVDENHRKSNALVTSPLGRSCLRRSLIAPFQSHGSTAAQTASPNTRLRFGYDSRIELFCCRINRKSDNPEHEEQPCEPTQRNGSQPRSGRLCSCSPRCGRQTQKNAGGFRFCRSRRRGCKHAA